MVVLAKRYLAHRRTLGFALRIEGELLLDFARFTDRTAPRQPLTISLALSWATLPAGTTSLFHAKRLEAVRRLARYCAALDPRTEIPPPRLLGPRIAGSRPISTP